MSRNFSNPSPVIQGPADIITRGQSRPSESWRQGFTGSLDWLASVTVESIRKEFRMPTPAQAKEAVNVSIRSLQENDLAEARSIFRMAFGTFMGVPDPETFSADCEYIFTRWHADPGAALAAEVDGKLAGSNFATNWGSFGFFGPLTVRPQLWDRHIAQALLAPTIDLFDQWGVREAGLFTFSHSPKHVGLYQKFGFWPRFLTVIMSKRVVARGKLPRRNTQRSPAPVEPRF